MADLPAPASDQAEPLVEASTDAATGLGPQPSEASATAAANIEEATMITAMADTALRGPESDTSSRQGITLPGEEVGGQERAAAADNGSESDAELVEHKYDIAIEEAAAREQADQANKFADLFRDQLQQASATYLAFAAPFDSLNRMVNERFSDLQTEHQAIAAKQRDQAEHQWKHAKATKRQHEQQAKVNAELTGALKQAQSDLETARAETERLARENRKIVEHINSTREASAQAEPLPDPLPEPKEPAGLVTDEQFQALIAEFRAALESKIARLALEQEALAQNINSYLNARDDLSLSSEPQQSADPVPFTDPKVDRRLDSLDSSVGQLETFQAEALEQSRRLTEAVQDLSSLEQRLGDRFDGRLTDLNTQLAFLDERMAKAHEGDDELATKESKDEVTEPDEAPDPTPAPAPAPVVVAIPDALTKDDLRGMLEGINDKLAMQGRMIQQQQAMFEQQQSLVEQQRTEIANLKGSLQQQHAAANQRVEELEMQLRTLDEYAREEITTAQGKLQKLRADMKQVAEDQLMQDRKPKPKSEPGLSWQHVMKKIKLERDVMSLVTVGTTLPGAGLTPSKKTVLPADTIQDAHAHDRAEEEEEETMAATTARPGRDMHHQAARTFLFLKPNLEHTCLAIDKLVEFLNRDFKGKAVPERLRLKSGVEKALTDLQQRMSLVLVEWTEKGLSQQMEQNVQVLMREVEKLVADPELAPGLQHVSQQLFNAETKAKEAVLEEQRAQRERVRAEREEELRWAAEEAGEEFVPPEDDSVLGADEDEFHAADPRIELTVMDELQLMASHLSSVVTALTVRKQRLRTEDLHKDVEFLKRKLQEELKIRDNQRVQGLNDLESRFFAMLDAHVEQRDQLKLNMQMMTARIAELQDPENSKDGELGAAMAEFSAKLEQQVATSEAELKEIRTLMSTKASRNSISVMEKTVLEANESIAMIQRDLHGLGEKSLAIDSLGKQVRLKADQADLRRLTRSLNQQQEEAKRLAEEAAAAATRNPLRCLSCNRVTTPQLGPSESSFVADGNMFHAGAPLSAEPSVSGAEQAAVIQAELGVAGSVIADGPADDQCAVVPQISRPVSGRATSSGGVAKRQRPHTAGPVRSRDAQHVLLPTSGPFSQSALDQGALPISQRIYVAGNQRPTTAGRMPVVDPREARKRNPNKVVRSPARGSMYRQSQPGRRG